MEKLTHGAVRDGETVRIPADHPTFEFPKSGDGQAVAPGENGTVAMLASQLTAEQRKALGLPESDPVEKDPAPAANESASAEVRVEQAGNATTEEAQA